MAQLRGTVQPGTAHQSWRVEGDGGGGKRKGRRVCDLPEVTTKLMVRWIPRVFLSLSPTTTTIVFLFALTDGNPFSTCSQPSSPPPVTSPPWGPGWGCRHTPPLVTRQPRQHFHPWLKSSPLSSGLVVMRTLVLHFGLKNINRHLVCAMLYAPHNVLLYSKS